MAAVRVALQIDTRECRADHDSETQGDMRVVVGTMREKGSWTVLGDLLPLVRPIGLRINRFQRGFSLQRKTSSAESG